MVSSRKVELGWSCKVKAHTCVVRYAKFRLWVRLCLTVCLSLASRNWQICIIYLCSRHFGVLDSVFVSSRIRGCINIKLNPGVSRLCNFLVFNLGNIQAYVLHISTLEGKEITLHRNFRLGFSIEAAS